jgi:hypothetical protein
MFYNKQEYAQATYCNLIMLFDITLSDSDAM